MTIKSILIYTTTGQVLYKWENEQNSIGKSHTVLVPGFFSALSSVLGTIFQDRLQRLILEHNAIVLTGREINVKSFEENSSKLIIMSVLVDLNDDISLINKIINKIYDFFSDNLLLEDNKLKSDPDIDQYLMNLIHSKEYRRSVNKIVLSSFVMVLSTFIATFIYLINYDVVFPQLVDYGIFTVPEVIAIFISGFLFIPSAFIAGSRNYSGLAGIIGSTIGSIISFIIFEAVKDETIYIEGFGTPLAYFIIVILFGFVYGSIGGYLMEKYYLFK